MLIVLSSNIRVIDIPFPDERLANVALRALSVDKELSPLVDRTFEVVEPADAQSNGDVAESCKSALRVTYRATTNRMLRVSVNGFFESLRLVVQVMEDLDVDVCSSEMTEDLTKVQGLNEAAAGV
jgi:EKC/KEOPS complex subunit PCC1/LAGE3